MGEDRSMTEIEFRNLGRSSLRVSTIGLGCNNFGRIGSATETQEGTTAVIDRAIELGVTLLDTADIYGGGDGLSETLMGVALRGRRDEVVIATKFGHSGVDLGFPDWGRKGSRTYIRNAVQASLRRLQVEYIDLYQMHTPDDETPIEETIGALEELVSDGIIREYGNSNFSAAQISDAQASADSIGAKGFIPVQNEYSLIARAAEHDVLPVVRKLGLGFLPYFPLHNGLLTGKFTRQGGPADSRIMRSRKYIVENAPWDALEKLQAFCAAHEITMLEASITWLLAQESISSVIAGVTHPEQLDLNARASTSWRPTSDDLAQISAMFTT
jgi:1-deoxyxylulose-5-phosphate synthase